MFLVPLLLAGIALAAPPTSPERPEVATDWASSASLSLGEDAWTGGGASAAELRATGWTAHQGGEWQLSGGYSGLVQVLATGGAFDAHVVELRAQRAGRVHAGIVGETWFGLTGLPTWASAGLGPALDVPLGRRLWMGAQLTGGWRGDASAGGPTVGSRASTTWRPRPGLTLGALARAELTLTPDLPPWVYDLELRARLGTGRRLDASLAYAETGASDTAVRAAGLPEPGARLLRAHIGLEQPMPGPLALRLDLAGESGFGTVHYERVRAFVTLVVHLGAARSDAPAWLHPAGEMVFSLEAAEASQVAIAGTFTGWQPVPMERTAEGRWRATLALTTGEHEYVYIVDGQAIAPPEARLLRSDSFGGQNGVILVTP